MRKVLGWALIIFLVFFVVTRPAAAAAAVKGIAAKGIVAMDGIGSFFANLTV